MQLINQIAYQSPKFMRPYMNPVLVALIPKLRMGTSHVDVTVQVFACWFLVILFFSTFSMRNRIVVDTSIEFRCFFSKTTTYSTLVNFF